MEVVDKIAEPKDPLALAARKGQSLEPPPPLPIPIKASWKGKTSQEEQEQEQEQDEKDLPDDGEESFRTVDSSDEGGRTSFSGASHPLEPIDMDLMKTVYVAIDEEKPEPPVCLVRGLSVQVSRCEEGCDGDKTTSFSEGVNWDLIHYSMPPEVPRPVEAELPMKYRMPVAIANNSKRAVGA